MPQCTEKLYRVSNFFLHQPFCLQIDILSHWLARSTLDFSLDMVKVQFGTTDHLQRHIFHRDLKDRRFIHQAQ